MKIFLNGLSLLLLWMIPCLRAQSSYYKREYYHPIAVPTHRFYHNNNGFVPLPFKHDLVSEESKRKVSPKKYSKRIPDRPRHHISDEEDFSNERFNSNEYSGESHGFGSQEDSREYTIGTHIRVQHPISVPKKITSSFSKPHAKHTSPRPIKSYSDFNLSSESSEVPHPPPPPPSAPSKKPSTKFVKLYEPDPFHIIPPPKSTSPAVASSNFGYNVYEPEIDDYDLPSLKGQRDSFKGIASKKQIDQYLKDQQKKLLDEALKLQLLSSPDFKRFLKAKEKELLEKERDQFEDFSGPDPPSHYRQHFNDNLTFTTSRPPPGGHKPHHRNRRPHGGDLKRSPPKRKPSGPSAKPPNRKFRSAVVIEV